MSARKQLRFRAVYYPKGTSPHAVPKRIGSYGWPHFDSREKAESYVQRANSAGKLINSSYYDKAELIGSARSGKFDRDKWFVLPESIVGPAEWGEHAP